MDVTTVAQMIQYLCSQTELTDCQDISKRLSRTVRNAERLQKYTKRVKEYEQRGAGLLEQVDWGQIYERASADELLQSTLQMELGRVGDVLKLHLRYTKMILSERKKMQKFLQQDDLLHDLKDVTQVSQFESIVQQLTENVDTSWWGCGISWLKRQFYWWKEKIVAFAKWISDPKKLTIILVVLWLLVCQYNKYKESKRITNLQCLNDTMMMRAGKNPTAIPIEPSKDTITTSCAKTDEFLSLLQHIGSKLLDVVRNAFLSLFSLNKEYVIPQSINPLANTENWDYILSKNFSEIGFLSGCTVLSAASGVSGSLGSAGAAFLGLSAAPVVVFTGVVSLTLGLVCYAGSRAVNETVVKPTINQEYLALERTILRPYLMYLWDKVFNAALRALKLKKTTAERISFFITSCMNIFDTMRSFQMAFMTKLKNQYLAYGMGAFKGALAVATGGYEAWRLNNQGKKNEDLVKADADSNLKARLALDLPQLSGEKALDSLTRLQKYQILLILTQLGLITSRIAQLSDVDKEWKQHEDTVRQFYFDETPPLKF